jgi:hypothetical protein
MFAYWLLFAVFAIGAAVSSRNAYMPAYAGGPGSVPASAGTGPQEQPIRTSTRGLFLTSLLPIILIGFRYRVGTDYSTYVFFFKRIGDLSLGGALNNSDVGYATLSWLAAQIGTDLWLVNLVCGILFTFGLVKFAKIQPNPWLAITIAIPYLVITVGMNLSRQAVAIGLGMAGLAAISRGSYVKFAMYVLAGALFHRTALILIPVIGLAYSRNRLISVLVAVSGSVAGYYVLTTGGAFEHFEQSYFHRAGFESQGAAVRLAMNIPPATLFLLFVKRFSPDPHERLIYVILSIISIISLVLLIVYPAASTPLDRMALYVIPLQIFVLSRLPSVLPDGQGHPSGPLTLAIVLYSAAVEFVWLNYATFAPDWIPYRFVPLFG